jgi:hypothetical protein
MVRNDKRPIDPRQREPMRDSGPNGDSRKRGKSADERRESSIPEQNRKLGKRHD